jgi:hypothetical protein
VKEQIRYKRITASGGGTLEAQAHEGFRILDIFCNPSTNDDYVTVMVDSVTVVKLRVKGKSGNHLPYPNLQLGAAYEQRPGTLLAQFGRAGYPLVIPVAAGQIATLSRYAETGDLTVVYSVHDPADVRSDEPNGSDAKVRRYPHYVTNSAAITASPTTLDTSLIHTGGDSWPVGDIAVGSGKEIVLLGIAAAPASRGNGSLNKGYTTYLELWHEGDALFTDGIVGLPLGGLSTQTADATVYTGVAAAFGPGTQAQPALPLWLAEPMPFKAGAKLTPKLATSGAASGGLVAADLDVAFLLESRLIA